MALHTALNKPWHSPSTPFEADFNVTDIAIGGKLIQASLKLDPLAEMSFISNDEYKKAIKQKLASEIARAMIETNSIEFTHLPQRGDGNDIIYARCYLAPSDQVKLLRIHYAKPVHSR
mgnify:CR=1 FL=1